jgi:hypothetical protein
LGHVGQFAVFGLADRSQLSECVLGAAPAASPQQADRLIDHRSRRQRGLQLDRQRRRLGEDLRVVHGDRRGFGEQLAEFGGVLIEDILVVGVDVDRPDHLIGQQQRQRQCTVHAQPAHTGAEPRPHLLPAQRPRPHRAALQCCGDAGTLLQGDVLNFVDFSDKRRTRRQRFHHVVDPIDLQQGHPGTLCAGDRVHCECRHLGQQRRQPATTRHQACQLADGGLQVGGIGAGLLRGQ